MLKSLAVSSGLVLCLAALPALADPSHNAMNSAMKDPKAQIWPAKLSDHPETIVYDAATAMQLFRTLEGEWVAVETTGRIKDIADVSNKASAYADDLRSDSKHTDGTASSVVQTKFEVKGRGSFVEQSWLEGTPAAMTVVLHQDGPDKLLYHHYCAARNVINDEFVPTGKPGEIKMEYRSGYNYSGPGYSSVYQVIDKDTIQMYSAGDMSANGKPAVITYKRKPVEQQASAQ